MTKVEIDFPGAIFTQDVVVAVPQPTSPSTATPPDIGLVEISAPKVLVPGPPGPQGPQGIPGAPGTDGEDGSPDTAAQVLAKLITVDGSGSLLDADTLDGQDGAYYLDWDNFTDKPATFPPTLPIDYTTGISGKPSTFPPSAHGHPFTDITGAITDAQHGSRGGGTLHAAATAATAGFFTDAASDGTQYVRKNGAWAAVTVPPGTYIGDTPPGSPTNGQLWWESDTGNFFIWYVDVAGPGQWVQINAAAPIAPLPGSVVDSKIVTYTTNVGLTAVLPLDNTIPQNTEGTEIITTTFAAKSATNKLRCRFQGQITCTAIVNVVLAFFKNADAGAWAATWSGIQASGSMGGQIVMEQEFAPGTTAPQTIAVRIGPGAAGTIRMNGTTAAALFGGIGGGTTLTIEEIAA